MKKEISQELKELKSSLITHKKTEIYEVNDDYFAEMQKSVLSKVDQHSKNTKVVNLFSLKKILGIAAVFVVMIGSVFIINQNIKTGDELNEITSEKLYEYLLDNIDDLDNEMFAMVIDENDFEEESSETLEDVIDYLENDLEDLTEEELYNLL